VVPTPQQEVSVFAFSSYFWRPGSSEKKIFVVPVGTKDRDEYLERIKDKSDLFVLFSKIVPPLIFYNKCDSHGVQE
jgi:hypothetical protein